MALALMGGLLTGGCSTKAGDATPMPLGDGPVNTGTFPNLNIPQQAAAPQLTQEETDAKLAALRRAQHTQSPGATYESAEQRRKRLKLLGDEQAETLRVIEAN